jgi:spore maturation protein SpmA
VLNGIFAFLVLAAVVTAAFGEGMPDVTRASLESAKSASSLALGLIGQMALWLGFMAVLERAGVLRSLARAVKPVMTRLFPGVPPEHPAMSAMVLNIVANMLGLGNAATPFGIKAVVELDRLNDRPGVATDAMALFLAINTSGVAVLPLGVIAGRAELGAENVSGIMLPSVLATFTSTLVAIAVAKLLAGRRIFARDRYPPREGAKADGGPIPGLEAAEAQVELRGATSRFGLALAAGVGLLLAIALARRVGALTAAGASPLEVVKTISNGWLLPLLMTVIVLVGVARAVKVYEAFVEGAKAGFRVAVTLIPYLVAILVAVGMFRASGAMDILLRGVGPVTRLVGMPPEVLPMALVRPLSGSGAYGVMMETMKTHGPDSFVGFVVSVMNGSTETTFYVLAVYFGAAGVRAVRHTVAACLAADLTGALMAVVCARVFF